MAEVVARIRAIELLAIKSINWMDFEHVSYQVEVPSESLRVLIEIETCLRQIINWAAATAKAATAAGLPTLKTNYLKS